MKVKILKLLLLFLLFQFCNQLFASGIIPIIPIFYDKTTSKTYGLFVHEARKPETEWSTIYYNETRLPSVSAAMGKLKELFTGLYDQFEFQDKYEIDMDIRGTALFIPAKKFVSAEKLSKLSHPKFSYYGDEFAEVNGFIWLDLDHLAAQSKDQPRTFEVSSKNYRLESAHGGFEYFFPMHWKSRNFSEKLDNYKEFMKSQPVQQVVLQAGQITLATPEPKPIQPIIPEKPKIRAVVYPPGTKEEHKFYYDAHYGDKTALLKDIVIAKKAGTVNWQGTDGLSNSLTRALSNYSEYKDPEIIKILLENGVDPNIYPEDMWSPLIYALSKNLPKNIIELLLKYHADPNKGFVQLGLPYFPLQVSIEYMSSKEIVELLLQYGADPNMIVKVRAPWGAMEEKSLFDLAKNRPEIEELLKKYAKLETVEQPIIGNLVTNLEELNVALNSLAQKA